MQMTIRTRLTILGTLLTVIPTIVVSVLLTNVLTNEASRSLTDAAQQKLTALNATTAENIHAQLNNLMLDAKALAHSTLIEEAVADFDDAYAHYADQLGSTVLAHEKETLAAFYQQQFDTRFKALNDNKSSNPLALLANYSPMTIALQHDYIAANPSALGEKDQLKAASGPQRFNSVHERYHDVLHEY